MSFNSHSEYIVFSETAVTDITQKVIPLETLVTELKKYKKILENLTPNQLGVLIPLFICTESGLSIALALEATRQGSLLADGGIEESARREIVEKIKAAEKIAVSSIQSGKKAARELNSYLMSREELAGDLKGVQDKKVTRETIYQERNPPFTIDYPNSSQTLGSNKKIPTHLSSEQKITYTQCMVKQNLGGGEFEILTPDYLKTNDNSLIKKEMIKVFCDPLSNNYLLVQLAHLFNAKFEFEALLNEEVRSGKKTLQISKVDHEKVIKEIEVNFTSLKENLSFGF